MVLELELALAYKLGLAPVLQILSKSLTSLQTRNAHG
jgi:hypothetical protein